MTLVGEKRLPEPSPSPMNPSLQSMISSGTTTTPTTPTATTTTATPQNNLPQEYIHRAAWKAGLLGALNVVTAVLAVRLILLVSVCGAIALAYLALTQPDPYRLGALAIYAVVVVLPMVWLSARR
jgi:hypothetical protein